MNNIFFITLLSLLPTALNAAPYKGVGSQVEAYGKVMGNYYVSLAFTEVCGEYASIKSEAESTARNYLHENFALLSKLRKRLDMLALTNGGEREKTRLNSEISNALFDMQSMAKQEARKQAISPSACKNILANLRKGTMDIRTRNTREIKLITGD